MTANVNVLVLPTHMRENDSAAIIIPSTRSAPQKEVSYKHLVAITDSLHRDLAHLGITKACKVAIVLPNGLEFVAVFLSVLRQRAVAAPLDAQLTESEFKDIFSRMKPELVIMLPIPPESSGGPCLPAPAMRAALGLTLRVALCRRTSDVKDGSGLGLQLALDLLEPAHSNHPAVAIVPKASAYSRDDVWSEDGALMLFTSGTTGAPKSVVLSHINLLVAMRIIIANHQLSSMDRTIIITPLHHIIGVCGSLLVTLFSGACAVIPDSLPGAFWQYCTEFGVTWFHAVPTLHRLLLKFPRTKDSMPPRLRFLRSGGSEMAPDLYETLKAFGVPVLEVYGMTETGPAIFCNHLDENGAGARQRSHYPIPDAVDVMILVSSDQPEGETYDKTSLQADQYSNLKMTKEPGVIGEVCVRGKNVMAGYINNSRANTEAFLPNGYFRTGDLGTIQSSGQLKLVGRLKEVINKGGIKIGPSEVEHAALSHESVSEAVCFRIADVMYGEEIGLAVKLRSNSGKNQCTDRDLKQHIRYQLSAFKVPKEIVFVDAVHYNRTGKPLRTQVSQKFAEGLL
uniref:Acyl-CoA synthetase ALT10 n=1 Tax=Alternaria alternata TaxID=5599 RepID=ALT10_ALTAL|nr:RecName: Full=Acyl-CoA synthetase ALT10; AltName: Full=AAL-toxin biosynthesis cluster protein 10 [Alternaria alternata]BBG74285.1 peroxisomal-coenzyme A synthetase [Alternaria alternata]